MTVEEIFSNINAHMLKGISIHNQIANAFSFLNLFGYQKCHEYHYYEESNNCRCLNDFYLNQYHKLIVEQKIDELSNPIIPSSWYKYTREDVDINTKRQAVRDLYKKWVDWETETRDSLQRYYKQLYDLDEICAAKKIAYFLEDVNNELCNAYQDYIYLKSVDYDIVHITELQDSLLKTYKKKIHNLYKGGENI